MRSLALSRVDLGRLQREVGELDAARSAMAAADAWFRASGGGDEAAWRKACSPRWTPGTACPGLPSGCKLILEKAQAAENLEVQVVALDALAGLRVEAGNLVDGRDPLDRADPLMATPGHKLTRATGSTVTGPGALSDAADADDIAPGS